MSTPASRRAAPARARVTRARAQLTRARGELVGAVASRYRRAVTGGRHPGWVRFAAGGYLAAVRARRALARWRAPAPPDAAPPVDSAAVRSNAVDSTGVRSTGVRSTGVRSTAVRSTAVRSLECGLSTLVVGWPAAAGDHLRLVPLTTAAAEDATNAAAGFEQIAARPAGDCMIATIQFADLAALATGERTRWRADVDGIPLGVEDAAGLGLDSAPRAETRIEAADGWRTVSIGWTGEGQLLLEMRR